MPVINIVNDNRNNVEQDVGQEQMVVQQTFVDAYPETTRPKHNKWVALALLFFFGFFGGHKFYEGKYIQGILYFGLFVLYFVIFSQSNHGTNDFAFIMIPLMLLIILCTIDFIRILLKPHYY